MGEAVWWRRVAVCNVVWATDAFKWRGQPSATRQLEISGLIEIKLGTIIVDVYETTQQKVFLSYYHSGGSVFPLWWSYGFCFYFLSIVHRLNGLTDFVRLMTQTTRSGALMCRHLGIAMTPDFVFTLFLSLRRPIFRCKAIFDMNVFPCISARNHRTNITNGSKHANCGQTN